MQYITADNRGNNRQTATIKYCNCDSMKFGNILRIHKNINDLDIKQLHGRKVGVSIGWSQCLSADDIVDAFRCADNALYAAKDKGRNVIIESTKLSG